MKYVTNGAQWKEGHAVIENAIFYRICIFPPFPPQPLSRVLRDCNYTVQVERILLRKGQYLHVHHLMSYPRLFTYYAVQFGN
jgi:hypothetical protein